MARARGVVIEVEGGGEEEGSTILLGKSPVLAKIVIGNLFNGVHTMPDNVAGLGKEARSWTAFVKEETGHSLARIIKHVSFELAHKMPPGGDAASLERSLEKHAKPSVVINAEPFEISRWSTGPYCVNIHITLTDSTTIKVSHYLCLYNSGGWSDRKESTQDDTFPVTRYLLCHTPAVTAGAGGGKGGGGVVPC